MRPVENQNKGVATVTAYSTHLHFERHVSRARLGTEIELDDVEVRQPGRELVTG